MKKNLLSLVCVFLAIMLTTCNRNPGVPPNNISDDNIAPIIWRLYGIAFANYQTGSSDESTGYDLGVDDMHVGRMNGGGYAFALLRLSLGDDFFAEEVMEARLFMKITGGLAPDRFDICLLTDWWTSLTLTNSKTQNIMDNDKKHSVRIQPETNDWISFPITGEVKTWLSGEIQNSGIALMTEDGAYFSFDSGNRNDGFDVPYISMKGKRGNRSEEHGRFGFTRIANTSDDLNANCLSYALRDIHPIYLTDFGGNIGEINRIYRESGENAVTDYISGLIEDYVSLHQEGLRIHSFRRLTGFDDTIDNKNEYRIALRIGCQAFIDQFGVPYIDPRAFDFHLWAQLNDGRWTQKFPVNDSEIIPGTVPNISPEQFIWNSAQRWGNAKWMNYYTSKVIFYAVTKDTDEFTNHILSACCQ